MNAFEAELATAATAWADCRDRWRTLAVFGVVWRVASALLLAPAYALVLRTAVAGSGAAVLTDTDLLYFGTSLIGVAGLVAIGTAGVALIALEVTALLAILSQPSARPSLADALGFTLKMSPKVVRVAARLVIHALLWLAPAALVAAATYGWLLSEFDINYYLTQRPPAFWGAGAIAAGVAIYIVLVATRLATDWLVALPVVLFEGVPPQQAYANSRVRTEPHRWSVGGWILGWAIASSVLSTVVAGLVGGVIGAVTPFWPRSLVAVAAGVGLGLVALIVVALAVNLLSSVLFAAILRRLYLRFGGRRVKSLPGEPILRGVTVTRPRLIAAACLAALASVTVGYAALASVPIEDEAIIIGHRGAPLAAPENSLSSVEAAIRAGADWVEIDVQETADGEVVVFHDSDFMKAAGVALKTWEATLDDLQTIDIGSRFGVEFADERVPTLAEVLNTCRGKVGVVVELKYYGHDVSLEQRVAEIVERCSMVGQTKFMSLEKAGVEKLKALRPEWPVGQLLSVALGNEHRLQADFLAINAAFASRRLLNATHRDGRQVYVWTVNDPVAMSSLIGRGVDGLITDKPDVARAVLRERAEMTPAGRLLVELADRFRLISDSLIPGAAATSTQ